MFTKAGLLIAVFLVFMGYRWGSRRVAASRAAAQPASQATTQPASASPKREIFSLKLLLAVVIVLLIIAILTSLQR